MYCYGVFTLYFISCSFAVLEKNVEDCQQSYLSLHMAAHGHGGNNITAFLLLLVLLDLDGCHHLGGMARPQAVRHLGQLLQVGQLSTGEAHLDGHDGGEAGC